VGVAVRQYGFVPSPLAASNTPGVSATTGLGTGGGAGVQTPDSGNFGDVFVYAGSGVATSGSVALTFPGTPPAMFISGDPLFGTITQATVGSVLTISWTGATLKARSTPYVLHYEWDNPLKAN